MKSVTARSGTPRSSRVVAAVCRGVVEAGFADTGCLKQLFPLVLIAARVDGLAGRLGEHPVAFMPLGPGVLAFLVLSLAVLGDQSEELLGQRSVEVTAQGNDRAPPQLAGVGVPDDGGVVGVAVRAQRPAGAGVGFLVPPGAGDPLPVSAD
jgi:hypothetical protein